MERTIILPSKNSNYIDADSIRDLDDGIIIVYNDEKIIGSVIFEPNCEEFLLCTLYNSSYYENIKDIVAENSEYTFKYITQDA